MLTWEGCLAEGEMRRTHSVAGIIFRYSQRAGHPKFCETPLSRASAAVFGHCKSEQGGGVPAIRRVTKKKHPNFGGTERLQWPFEFCRSLPGFYRSTKVDARNAP